MGDAHTIDHLPTHIIAREALLRLPAVRQLTGYSTTTIYDRMNEGTFPVAVQMGPRAVAWRAGEVLDWIEARPRVAVRGRAA